MINASAYSYPLTIGNGMTIKDFNKKSNSEIINQVCEFYEIKGHELMNGCRRQPIPKIRRILAFIFIEKRGFSLQRTGLILGIKHSSAFQAKERLKESIAIYPKEMENLKTILKLLNIE